ncbi:MAG: hypothetical protein GX786_06435, partial [Clostridiales bacterium]|nr:hypothetical protein [Clostridiales bacterium]
HVVYDMVLASVRIPANSANIIDSYIDDTRHDKNLCGMAAPLIFKEKLENLHDHPTATGAKAGYESIEHYKRVEELAKSKRPSFAGLDLDGSLDLKGFPIDNATFR